MRYADAGYVDALDEAAVKGIRRFDVPSERDGAARVVFHVSLAIGGEGLALPSPSSRAETRDPCSRRFCRAKLPDTRLNGSSLSRG